MSNVSTKYKASSIVLDSKKMYEKCKNITVPTTASAQVKNLQVGFVSTTFYKMKVLPPSDEFVDNFQVVSFDAEWREVYVGYVRKDVFTGVENDGFSCCSL